MDRTLRKIRDNIVACIFIVVLVAFFLGLLVWPVLKFAAFCKFLFG